MIFNVDYLSDVHASLNDRDKLRYNISKVQKALNPMGQSLLGVLYNYSRNINNFCEYVRGCRKFYIFVYTLYYSFTLIT
jgi:hypothetical protein